MAQQGQVPPGDASDRPPPDQPPPSDHPVKVQVRGWRNWGDHPVVVGITLLAGVFAIFQFFRHSPAPPPGPDDPGPQTCAGIAGRWDWLSTGGVVAFTAEGAMHWYQIPTDRLPTVSGRWECNDARQPLHFTLRWTQTGLVDTLSLSADGQHLTGENLANHFKLSATRAR